MRLQLALLAAIEGAILGAMWQHVLGGLVSPPSWTYVAVIGIAGVALVRTARPAVLAACLCAGIFCGATLPPSLAPPEAEVMTHAPPGNHGSDLFEALERLDDDPQAMLGREISVRGFWRPARPGVPAAVFLPVMACCAADAVDVGFDVIPRREVAIASGEATRVSGIVTAVLAGGETRYRLVQATLERLVPSARNTGARRTLR